MCWSGGASLALAVGGFVVAAHVARRDEPAAVWLPLAYFSLMELLQAGTYPVLDQCSLPANQVMTVLAYIHIAFQPFFINIIAMYFIPDSVRRRIKWPVYGLCGIGAVIMLLQLYPFEWAGRCLEGTILCSDYLCAVSGSWHLAWEIPVNGMMVPVAAHPLLGPFLSGHPAYMIAAFYLPFLYGSWRFTAFHLVTGPLLAMLLTDNPNEVPTIWCLFSIAILLLVLISPLRHPMHVTGWIPWRLLPGHAHRHMN